MRHVTATTEDNSGTDVARRIARLNGTDRRWTDRIDADGGPGNRGLSVGGDDDA